MGLIFVAGSKTFDITQFRNIANAHWCMNMGIQSERFTLGSYDWVLQFYPHGTSEWLDSTFFLKVLNATEVCRVVSTTHGWNWTTSKWDFINNHSMIYLQPSGDKARSYLLSAEMSYFENKNFLKDDVIRIKFDLLVTPRPPDVHKPADTGNPGNPRGGDISFPNGFHTANYAPPDGPKNTKLPIQPTVRIYCKANKDLSLTIRNGTVVLAPANSNDYYQHWIKDMSYGDKVKDIDGVPVFALVNRVTGEALKNPAGENEKVSLVPYNPNHLEDSVKWTEVWSTGFRIIRMADMTSLNLTAVGSNNDTNFSDGTKIVVKMFVNTPIQHWNIVPYNSNHPY